VLAAACAAIATVARGDEENLAVMTDQGVVALLARLTCTVRSLLVLLFLSVTSLTLMCVLHMNKPPSGKLFLPQCACLSVSLCLSLSAQA